MRKKRRKVPTPTRRPLFTISPDWLPLIAALLAGPLSAAVVLSLALQGAAWIERHAPAQEPTSWADRVEESDTSWPAYYPEDDAEPTRLTWLPWTEEPQPPRGRCGEDEDCRSGGYCVKADLGFAPAQYGVCGECRGDGDCDGDACSDRNTCVQCVMHSHCPGSELCQDERCVPPEAVQAAADDVTVTPSGGGYYRFGSTPMH